MSLKSKNARIHDVNLKLKRGNTQIQRKVGGVDEKCIIFLNIYRKKGG
jgi:hypothetical protein